MQQGDQEEIPFRCACGRPSHGPHPDESEWDRLCSHCLAVRRARVLLTRAALVLLPLALLALYLYERWLSR